MPAIEMQQIFGACSIPTNAGDRVMDFEALFTVFDASSHNAKGLLETRPIQMTFQTVACLQKPNFDATVA